MNKRTITMCTILLALAAVAFFALSESQAGVVRRVSAEFLYFTPGSFGLEATSIAVNGPLGTGGTQIYSQTVDIKPGEKVMYVTMSTTGDQHDGVKQRFACLVDGVPCNPGGGGINLANTGWITLRKMPAPADGTNCNDGFGGTGDCHDQGIYYTWCVAIQPPPRGPRQRTVSIRMATEVADVPVFIEQAHFFIDLQQGSASGTPTPTCIEGAP
ncbi:MAG: hypothetical protein ACRD88_13795 [Terriglobia bacterium]